MKYTTGLHGGICHRTQIRNNTKRKKKYPAVRERRRMEESDNVHGATMIRYRMNPIRVIP